MNKNNSLSFFLLITTVSLLFFSLKLQAKEVKDLHYTTLLPLITNLKPQDKKNLEQNIIQKLQTSKVLQFKTHNDFYKIFEKEGENLKEALYNKEVLTTVSEKLLVGSMLRIEVYEYLLGYEVTLDVLSPNGNSIYRRQKKLSQKTISFLSYVINFWIEGYTETAPFDASIVEVSGDNLLVDFPGKRDELFPNRQFVVLRQKPDDFELIAYGVVTKIGKEFFEGKILDTKEGVRVSSNDLIRFEVFDEEAASKNLDYKYRTHDLGNYRDKGKVSLYGSTTKISGNEGAANFNGATVGLDFFLPSNILLMLEFSRKIGQTSKKISDDSTFSGSSLNDNNYRALLGYSFTPENMNYISYFDLYAGWGQDQNYLSGLGVLGVVDNTFEGPVVGFRMEHPIYPNLAALTSFDYSIQPRFREAKESLGDAESTSSYIFQLGLRYRFERSGFCIEGLYRRKNSSADIKDSDMVLNIESQQILLGVSNFF